MANPEHLDILKQGVDAWNRWRLSTPQVEPDMSATVFEISSFTEEAFNRKDLRGINFSQTDLSESALAWADLRMADLSEAKLFSAGLSQADLRGADLTGADANGADFRGAKLNGACLRGANLISVDLSEADLSECDLSGAWFGFTTLGNIDLSTVIGLDLIVHQAPSTVGVDTIHNSKGNLTVSFLQGCGIPDEFISYIRSLSGRASRFYSCFISYSSTDQEFAERLHSDLQAKGVRVWFAPHDLPIGAKIRPSIDESIRVHDKLLLVLSEASVSSQWVEQEVETALSREREQDGRTVLFPIRIDDVVMEVKSGWPALLRNTRNVGDFTRWKDHDSYSKALDRLLRDLKAGA